MLIILSVAATIVGASSATSPPKAPLIGLLDNSCKRSVEQADYRTAPALFSGVEPAPLHRLADLPDAHEEILVNRTVSGCPLPVTVVKDVSTYPKPNR
jgi:hypothetical protein